MASEVDAGAFHHSDMRESPFCQRIIRPQAGRAACSTHAPSPACATTMHNSITPSCICDVCGLLATRYTCQRAVTRRRRECFSNVSQNFKFEISAVLAVQGGWREGLPPHTRASHLVSRGPNTRAVRLANNKPVGSCK